MLATLVVIAAAYPFLVGVDCDPNCDNTSMSISNYSHVKNGLPAEVTGYFGGVGGPVTSGQRVFRVLSLYPNPAPSTVQISYTPPTGATNVTFAGYNLPKNPGGPPPYIFENALLGPISNEITISYDAPRPWNPTEGGPPWTTRTESDTAVVTVASGNSYTFEKPLTVNAPAAQAPPDRFAAGEAMSSSAELAPELPPHLQSLVAPPWWFSELFFGAGNPINLTTSLCQQSVSYLQTGSFFIAVRYPVAAEGAPPLPFPFPMRYGAPGFYPRLDLLNESNGPPVAIVSLPLEARPERADFVNNQLPGVAGEHWVALAPAAGTPASCPANLSVTRWEAYSWLPIDPGTNQAAWTEKVFPGYFCFVNGSLPTFLFGPAQAGGLEAEPFGALDSPVTAMGPFPIRLTANPPDPPYIVSGPEFLGVKPPGQARLQFYVEDWGAAAITVTLGTSSTLHLSWKAYNDAAGQPNLASQITGPITITPAGPAVVWLVADIAAGVAGAETVILTASSSSPARSTWNSGLVWIGPPPNPGHKARRHLPRSGA
jgi:hypothetical protein